MSVLTIVYANTGTGRFDPVYYVEKHMKMAAKIWGDTVESITIIKGLAALPDGKPPFHAILNVVFKSAGAMGLALSGPEMPTLLEDVVNYTDVTPVVQLSEVLS